MPYIRDQSWKLPGAILAVLGFIFLVGRIIAYASGHTEYVAVLIVFGGIFLVVGIGLVAIASEEKKAPRLLSSSIQMHEAFACVCARELSKVEMKSRTANDLRLIFRRMVSSGILLLTAFKARKLI